MSLAQVTYVLSYKNSRGLALHQRVCIVQRILPEYRLKFFELLRRRLQVDDIDLTLFYGSPEAGEGAKNDTADLGWAHPITNHAVRVGKHSVLWQPVLWATRDYHLVIAEQASRLLVNAMLQARYLAGGAPFAFWGHGKNFQSHRASALGEWYKRLSSKHVHWWFAYNDRSADEIVRLGYPRSRITSVQNAIDTRSLSVGLAELDVSDIAAAREATGLHGSNICVFAGGMYEEKRIPFLLEACTIIREHVPDFEIVFIGSGPDAPVVQAAASKYDWIKYVGTKFGPAKLPYFALSKYLLMPGLVGLVVLDSFALRVPIITTDVTYHSPEISYLTSGQNGIMLGDGSPADYASGVVRLLRDDAFRMSLIAGCDTARAEYTLEEMVRRFSDGIRGALAT